MSDPGSKVWFITGSSRGFGRIWAEAALERGDRVAATARDVSSAILAVVDAEEPPLRCFFGDWALAHTKEEYERRVAVWEQWDEVAAGAQGS